MVMANTGSSTYRRPLNTPSVLDLTFYTSGLPITWTASTDTNGSDYFLIYIRFADDSPAKTKGDSLSLLGCLLGIPASGIVRSSQVGYASSRPSVLSGARFEVASATGAKERAQPKFRRTRRYQDKYELKTACVTDTPQTVLSTIGDVTMKLPAGREKDDLLALTDMMSPHNTFAGALVLPQYE